MTCGRKKQFAVFVLLAVCAVSTSCTRTKNQNYIFTYSNEQPLSALRSESMVFFKEELEKRSNNRVTVELYFGGVLGTERELMDMVAVGALQGTRGGLFADANPKFKLLMLPFLVENWDQAIRLVNSDFMNEINAGAEVNGFYVPATGISQGFRAHTNKVRPIRHPDDLKGLKMRVPSQDVFVQTARAFGANPQEISAVETYQAIQTRVVDGQDNPPSNIWDYKFHEVCDYMTITNYATGPDPLIVNLKWYRKLPADLQQLFDEVARETMQLSDKLNREKEQEFIDMLAEGVKINYVEGDALIPFQAAVETVYDGYIQRGEFTRDEIDRAKSVARGE